MLITTNVCVYGRRVKSCQQNAVDSPHVDQVLSECDGVGVSADCNRTIGVATLTLFAIRDANHGTGDLTDFGDFGSPFADDAADQIVWHSHFLLLRVRLRSTLSRTQLGASQCGQR